MPAILLHVLTLHTAVSARSAVLLARHVLALTVPNPPAQAPTVGLSKQVNTILGWGKYGAMICGVVGLFICGGKMMIGHRNRSSVAADGAVSIPYVLLGLSTVAAASGIVAVFL